MGEKHDLCQRDHSKKIFQGRYDIATSWGAALDFEIYDEICEMLFAN